MKYIACLFACLLLSCVSHEIVMVEEAAPEHIDFVREKIVSLTESETEAEVLQAALLLFRELNRRRMNHADAETLSTRIIDGFRLKFEAENSSESRYTRNYNTLLTAFRNFFGDESFPDHDFLPVDVWGEDFFALAEEMRAEDNGTLALHYLSRAVALLGRDRIIDGELSLDTLLWYMETARRYHNVEILELMIDTAERNHLPDTETAARFDEYRAYIARGWQAGTGIGASVTVWVDMGIRLENNIGFPERSIGTGFFVDPDGYIITNYHVIASEVDPEYEGKSELFIRPGSNPELRIPAEVVGYDRIFDIALIKAETEAPEVLSFHNSATPIAGSPLYVVGSPGGLANSVTSGIVSAGGRRFLQMGDFVQVDVPINPGNSGGPMFDAEGHLVGVVFAGIELFEGVNFAIPSIWIQYFYPQLFETGAVEHPWFGLALREDRRGLTVVYVVPDSPADKAGFQVDEIISAIDGRTVSSIPEVQAILLSEGIGYLHNISIESDRELSRLVYSEVRPYSPLKDIVGDKLANVWLPPLFGMKIATVGGLPNAYSITEVFPGGIADESGLSENDSFTLLNWFIEPQNDIAVLQVQIQKKTAGYLTDILQLLTYIELNSFL